MSRIKLKNTPRLRLADLLRRRKMTLLQFIEESGVQSYEGLVIRCQRIGVQPPVKDEYLALKPTVVSSQQDGVVVLEPPKVIDEPSGMEIDPDAPIVPPGVKVITDESDGPAIVTETDAVAAPDMMSAAPESSKRITRRKRRSKKDSETN